MLKRAGLDYWEHVDITYHEGIRELFAAYPDAEFYFLTKHGKELILHLIILMVRTDIFFVFGKETSGLPEEVLRRIRSGVYESR